MRHFYMFGTLLLLFSMIVALAIRKPLPTSSAEPIIAPAKIEHGPRFAGKWVGTWSSIANEGQGGKLTCETIAKSNDEWAATVLAEYSIADDGPCETFKVDLKGTLKDNAVVFDGILDLKEQGGVFKWKGLAGEGEFTGKYEGPGENGSFKMTRVTSTPGAKAAIPATQATAVSK